MWLHRPCCVLGGVAIAGRPKLRTTRYREACTPGTAIVGQWRCQGNIGVHHHPHAACQRAILATTFRTPFQSPVGSHILKR